VTIGIKEYKYLCIFYIEDLEKIWQIYIQIIMAIVRLNFYIVAMREKEKNNKDLLNFYLLIQNLKKFPKDLHPKDL
jgi:NAD-specific glutamate dehydrogenase